MLLHKIESPENFSFGTERKSPLTPRVTPLGEDVFRLDIAGRPWRSTYSHAVIDEKSFGGPPRNRARGSTPDRAQLRLTPQGGVELHFDGAPRLRSFDGQELGLLGKKWIMVFDYADDMRFYGLGEKYGALEKTGVRTRFWNTDVFSDFPKAAVYQTRVDPLYVSVPYLLVVRDGFAAGILLNNPFAAYMDIAGVEGVAQEAQNRRRRRFTIGAPDGRPQLYFIVGESAAEVTRKLHRLCGTTPLPPLWALGHHQCRWGYESDRDLRELAEQFRRHRIPNDGLWLDIDYMEGYRVFSFDRTLFPAPAAQIESIEQEDGHVVPILDPGVKADPDYPVYSEGVAAGHFCMTGEGRPYVGYVWPGRTVFPDFSLPETRRWWADHVREFAGQGISGVWIDMNDPSTGSADYEEMRFGRGRLPHAAYHNQYALGMQMATREGLLAASPGERPFVISRSGFISTGRYSAIWTGDNASNYANLAQSLQVCLNLSLSGVSFVGADVGGFGLDCTPELLVDWYKAAFLFPFFRNHSQKGTRRQEPWAMGALARSVISHYIRLRYKLLPYLYSLFADQATAGNPILRPLFLEFPSGQRNDLSRIQDQFMVGTALMQAPFVTEGAETRQVVLPSGSWYDPAAGGWVR
ncbi:glycoside hydrolase family 31 protein, partial [Salinispira pacifica]